ncbi:hypothetical protein HCJ93_24045 [Streptomyces sp. SBST2-5]|uniref:Ferric siderophore reductase C-terminal domain-containing protein n=1 Tax=Streptomyces composti TaxID=2720025 RepID=A0ABX1AD09_9ACTN|nr:(2Fe-2S)-binding protein [Streptomyces composti]NJP53055.1 hypothetical protein [Streptomyces composti]
METTAPWHRIPDLGPYFAVTYGEHPDPDGFRPLTLLHGDADVLGARVGEVARRTGTGQIRVAASTFQLGLAARLWSVALAAAAFTGTVPDLDPARLRWRTPPTGPVDLWLPAPRALPSRPAALLDTVVLRNLEPLNAAVRRLCGLSPHVLRGNSASALVGALRVLLGHAPPRPVTGLVRTLLDREPLAGTGTLTVTADGSPSFRRRSCCLYYRLPGGGLCGDCVLAGTRRTA